MTDRTGDPPPEALGEVEPSALALKVGVFLTLRKAEIDALNRLHSSEAGLTKGEDLQIEGDEINNTFVVVEGWLGRYRMLEDGRRQIVSFALPGDIVNLHGALLSENVQSVMALTDARVCSVPSKEIVALGQTHPRLEAAISWIDAREQNLLAEQVVRLGRRTAYERMAHLILELLHRLRLIDEAERRSYELPLTQEILGDALGLSLVHVNRVLRRLRDEGLIEMDGQTLHILDADRLAEVAEFDPSYLRHEEIPEIVEQIVDKSL